MTSLRSSFAALVVVASTSAFAQGAAGVSDERMRLPQAPGSISGVGENATVDGNQGALQYRIAPPIANLREPDPDLGELSLSKGGPIGISL